MLDVDVSTDSPIWTTREGKRIPINEMNHVHIKNAIAAIDDGSIRNADFWRPLFVAELELRKTKRKK